MTQFLHSCLSASIGFIRAAITAGYRPNPIPIMPLTAKLMMTDRLIDATAPLSAEGADTIQVEGQE